MKLRLNLFDPASLAGGAKDVRAFQAKVKGLGPRLTQRLTEDGVQQAKEMALYMNAYDSGELVNGIVPEYRDGKGYVVSTAEHSAFVEMGTGIRGKQDPNPYDYVPGWTYDVNDHGEKGWTYIGRDGKLHWTKGMPHRPFMYETYAAMRDAVPEIAKELMEDEET